VDNFHAFLLFLLVSLGDSSFVPSANAMICPRRQVLEIVTVGFAYLFLACLTMLPVADNAERRMVGS
jgi:maltodextrin utilization protein YvdJ